MLAFCPQTMKTGDLPHISHIECKPEDLGTELKVVACPVIGMCLYLELQEGKEPMRQKEFTDELKVTTACTVRLVKYTMQRDKNDNQQNSPKNTYLGDSWFGSMETVVAYVKKLRCNFVGVVENSHSRYLKKFLEETMKE